ncbi:hypothetical protein ABIA33_004985 [Streptacidiphilus sp. MAP12-16]|uniref:hypothetical protein n=1 Tax=Streptacidiphilus sp. MAP12-16 TaxID=3156300 RepID=UPI0035174FA2
MVIFFAEHFLVAQLDAIGPMLGLSASVTALLLSPTILERAGLPQDATVDWIGGDAMAWE